MSLSPLFPVRTSDLHVSIESTLHRTFVRLQSDQEKLTVFRVPAIIFKLKSFVSDSRSVPCATRPQRNTYPWSTSPMLAFAFTADSKVFSTLILTQVLDSLARVSRRGLQDHFDSDSLPSRLGVGPQPSSPGSTTLLSNPNGQIATDKNHA